MRRFCGGGDDFKWYIGKLNANADYDFEPKIELPVVVWVSKERPDILERFNNAFLKAESSNLLDGKNLLQSSMMKERYLEAPIPE